MKRLGWVVAVNVAILGSLNLDVVFCCGALPAPGETILCSDFRSGPGGKGLNQAVAARRAGAHVILVGAVGRDASGDTLVGVLEQEGIDPGRIVRLDDASTGLAHIMVDHDGENSIVVASGANKADFPLAPCIEGIEAPVFLAQLEVGLAPITAFFAQAREAGGRTILNAAPAIREASALFGDSDILIVNEHELAHFSGTPCTASGEAAIAQAAQSVLVRKDQTIIVTLGGRGTQIVDATGSRRVPARPVAVTDTTGAGDCFCGVLAASLAGGAELVEAVERANRAASLAVQRPGAATAMPTAAEIDAT